MTTLLTPMPHKAVTISMGPALVVIIVLVAIMTLPAGVFYLAGTTSMAAGALAAAILILIMRAIGMPGTRSFNSFGEDFSIAFLIIALLMAHFVTAMLRADEFDYVKAFGSLMVMAIVIIACGAAGSLFSSANDQSIRYATAIMMAVFLIAAVFSLVEIQPPSTTASEKPIFPFTEPSLFAGAFLPILAFMSTTARGWRRWVWILTGFALGFLLKNLSLVVGTIIVAIACFSIIRLVALGFLSVLLLPLLDITYFSDRINFDTVTNNNLSTLVYIQGWELIEASYKKTLGWGLGFQQLGYTHLNAPTSDLIYNLTGGIDFNLKEGSFALAKLISELGIFGCALALIYSYFAMRAFIKLRRIAVSDYKRPLGEILALCSVYTYVVDMYVRGAGYFSSSTMLLFVSFFILRRIS